MREASPDDDRLPNLFLIGTPKAATTAIAELLASSDEVALGRTKEPGILNNSSYGSRHQEALYLSHFNGCEGNRFRLDATPWTFYAPDAPETIDGLRGRQSKQILLSLREPFARIQSMYLDQVVRGRERRDFECAVRDSMQPAADLPLALSYLSTSSYAQHLDRWMRLDTAEVVVLFFEHVVDPSRSSALVDGLARHLEISLDGGLKPANVRSMQSPLLARPIDVAVAAASHLPAGAKARLRPLLSGAARQLLRRSPTRVVAPPSTEIRDPGLRRELDERLAEESRRLRSLLPSTTQLHLDPPEWVHPPGET